MADLTSARLQKWREVAEASSATVNDPKVTGDWHPVARSVVADQSTVILALLDEVDRLRRALRSARIETLLEAERAVRRTAATPQSRLTFDGGISRAAASLKVLRLAASAGDDEADHG